MILNTFKNKKKFLISNEKKARIQKEIEELTNLSKGIFSKIKEFELGYYITIIIDKTCIGINLNENKFSNLPDIIKFLMIIDYNFPENPPKILSRTNFCFPNLMDGRNLSNSIILKWNPLISLSSIAKTIPVFIKQILLSTSYHFYGKFELGAVYDLRNFNNMLVNYFCCKIIDDNNLNSKITNDNNYTIILSDDCFILFENLEIAPNFGKIIFWSTLFSIIDIQINKEKKVIKINFYMDEKNIDKTLKLEIDNILFFRETIVKLMSNLNIKIESFKLTKGQQREKRISIKDINRMNIEQIEDNIKYLLQKINHNEINFYVVNTYSILCGKAIEYYSINDNEDNKKKSKEILIKMKEILSRKDIQLIMKDDALF